MLLNAFNRCKLRVLDSFGTDAEFNYKYYQENIPGGRSVWGDLDLQLAQFMTMYRKSAIIISIKNVLLCNVIQ